MIVTRQLLALATILSFGLCLDFPNTPTVCEDMMPASTSTEPQTLPPPFRITVNKYIYKSGDSLNGEPLMLWKAGFVMFGTIIKFLWPLDKYSRTLNNLAAQFKN